MEQQALLGKYKNLSNNFSAQFSPNFDILFVVSTEMELVLRQLNVQIKEVPQVVIVLLGKCIRIQIDISMLEYKNECEQFAKTTSANTTLFMNPSLSQIFKLRILGKKIE